MHRLNTSASTALALTTALAATAGLAGEAKAAYIPTNSWSITVDNEPIGCPGTTTVTVQFQIKKSAFGGGLNGGEIEVELRDADGDNLFGGDETIGRTTYSWDDQDVNFVDVVVQFEVECVEYEDCCTIRGNAGTDDEGDPHEMYINVELLGGTFWNTEWESPKNQGGWIKYSFPMNCGCDENAGGGRVRYRPDRTDDGFSTEVAFRLPDGLDAEPLYFQAAFEFDQSVIALIGDAALIDPEIGDAFGPLEVRPTSEGLLVSALILDPFAVLQHGEIPLELPGFQVDPLAFGETRISHDPFNTFVALADGTMVPFGHSDGEIPLRPFDSEPPQVDIELVALDLVGVEPIIVGQPGAVSDNLDPMLAPQIELMVQVFDPDGWPIFQTQRLAEPDGSFVVEPGEPVPDGSEVRVTATDASGNVGFGQLLVGNGPCNPADIAPPYGILDLTDLSVFVTGFVTGSASTDLNMDGTHDLTDVSLFVSAFVAGCP